MNTLFLIAMSLAILGWLLLIVFHGKEVLKKLLPPILITLGLFYTYILIRYFSIYASGDSSSLEGVVDLFTHSEMVLLGWIHFLAFDLALGFLIVLHAQKKQISGWLVLPCLILIFAMGPVGPLFYSFILIIKNKGFKGIYC